MPRLHPARGIIEQDLARIADSLGNRVDVLQGATLLLTGAGGLLAAYLAETVAWLNQHRFSRPCRLLALVRRPEAGGRLRHLHGRSDVTFVEQDVRDPVSIPGELDFVIHAASRASPKSYLHDPLDTIDANTRATRQLLDLARLRRSRGVLFFSSAEIYGDVPPEHVPTTETYTGSHDCTHPRACYTEAKRFGEMLCATYWRQFQVPVQIVRPFHVFGPGVELHDGRVIADFLRDRLANRPIRVLGGGDAMRTFCYLADATIGFWLALFSFHHGEAFNIGEDREVVTIQELAEVVATLESPSLPICLGTSRQYEYLKGSPSRAYPDLTKARDLLGFHPTTTLREGLARTLDSLRPGKGDER